MSDVESIIDELLNQEQNIFGIAIIGKDGTLITQTSNWDVSGDIATINELIQNNPELGEKGITSLSVQGLKYMIVENTKERKIGTNISGKGHLIVAPVPVGGAGALICYISAQAGPRDSLFAIQEFAKKLVDLI